ncbi:MAG: methyltransferase [Pseudomonadota bacterium]
MRLPLAFDAGLARPDHMLCLHPAVAFDFAGVPADVVHPFRPTYDYWAGMGLPTTADVPGGRWPMAVVVATRSKDQTRDLIAQAAQRADRVVVDGQKTDGIESHYKALRQRVDIMGSVTKAHGRLFWFAACDVSDWLDAPRDVGGGLCTRAGVFSADGVDPASALLADYLPAALNGRVADFGAGWGYLAKAVLARGAGAVHLIEADHTALSCAQASITDPRAQFHWQDATQHTGQYDHIVMNPPFHRGRAGDPGLGERFIKTAARCLGPKGTLWMVANAHLPYEATLQACFGHITVDTPNRQFKIFECTRPKARHWVK